MLLRALQEGEIRAVGEDRARHVDVRVLAASNRDLKAEVARGAFPRGSVLAPGRGGIAHSPLRERPDDVPCWRDTFSTERGTRRGRAVRPVGRTPGALGGTQLARQRARIAKCHRALVALSPEGELDLALLSPGRAALRRKISPRLREKMDAYERGLIVDALRAVRGQSQ